MISRTKCIVCGELIIHAHHTRDVVFSRIAHRSCARITIELNKRRNNKAIDTRKFAGVCIKHEFRLEQKIQLIRKMNLHGVYCGGKFY